jgi:hypothetical protein
VPRLDVDLAPGLRNFEVDHGRELGAAARGGDERSLDGVDQRREVEGRADVRLGVDENLP